MNEAPIHELIHLLRHTHQMKQYERLPGELRRIILKLALRNMSIDQRRAVGVQPGRLVLPESFVDNLSRVVRRSPFALVKFLDERRPVGGQTLRLRERDARNLGKTCRVLRGPGKFSALVTGVWEVVFNGPPDGPWPLVAVEEDGYTLVGVTDMSPS